jgi:adenosylcobinamide-GDP ribazoletransferase
VSTGVRLALAMFSAVPVPASWHRSTLAAPRALLWLPIVGAALGAAAGLVATAVLARDGTAGTLAAALAVAALAALTRGLHLDGLADTADGLGARAPAERALAIMKQSDIGPFGVVAIAVVLLVDVTALALVSTGDRWTPVAVLAVAAATGRLAAVHAAVPGVPAARPGGFGSLVAGTASWPRTIALTAVVLGGGAALAVAVDRDVIGWVVAQCAALLVAVALRVHTTRRLGGVTGDVFGALIEVTTAASLVGIALAH